MNFLDDFFEKMPGDLGTKVGPAGGVGFVFDTRIRRRNIQKMRSIFLNARGQVRAQRQRNLFKFGTDWISDTEETFRCKIWIKKQRDFLADILRSEKACIF